MSSVKHTDKTSAEDKSIGFDYQYYYFLNKLLNLKEGETVGLEVMDDVHTKLSDDTQLLVQLKHTVQTRADGAPKNLTTMDVDLWKSLSNWSQVIRDSVAGRANVDKQLDFVKKTRFLLTSNKSENENNSFLSEISKFHKEKTGCEFLRNCIKGIDEVSKNTEVKKYINDVLNLKDEVLCEFFKNLSFDLGCDDIIQRCKTSIKEHKIAPEQIDEVFRAIDSEIRANNYFKVKDRKKVIFSFEDFYKDYRIHFDRARSHGLKIRRLQTLMPDKPEDQIFIKQLLDIADVEFDEVDHMAELTRQRLHILNNIEKWHQNGELTRGDIEDFEDEAKNRWVNKFRQCYRGFVAGDDDTQAAQSIIDFLRQEKLSIAGEELPITMCNGEFYDLSDRPIIGWRSDWEVKYK